MTDQAPPVGPSTARRIDPTVLDDVAEFARWHLASGDIDPVYPVLGHFGFDDDEAALRFVFLYVAYYNLPSAIGAWSRDVFRSPGRLPDAIVAKFPTGTERRGHRVPDRLITHLADLDRLAVEHGSLTAWLTADHVDDRRSNWLTTQAALRTVVGNGRWASYKTGEILATVLGWPLEPTDAGHDFSTGPRRGLADCYPETGHLAGFQPAVIEVLDQRTTTLGALLVDRIGVPIPVEQVETILCDWHSMVNGGYYVGHDIDLMLEQTNRAADRGIITDADADALASRRSASFDERWLGEANGWFGVRRPLRRYYRDHRIIRWWDW